MRAAWQIATHPLGSFRTACFIATLIVASLLPMFANPSTAHADSVVQAGTAWLGGGGVDIMAGGDGSHSCVAVVGAPGQSQCSNQAGKVYAGDKWQCAEMVNRLYLAKGWTTTTWWGNGSSIINDLPNHPGLTDQLQDHISYVNPGDVVTLTNDADPNGHAGIVNTVDSNGTIHIKNQNADLDSQASIASGTSLSAGNAHYNMVGWSGYHVQAIVHHPNGGGGNNSNLVKNGGFELGTTSWNIMPGTNFVIYSNGQPASTDVAFSGTHFAATNALQSNGSFYQDIPVTANAGDVFCADAEMRTQTGSPAPTVDTLGLFLLGGTTVDIGSRAYTNLPNDGSTWLNEKTCVTAAVTQPTLRVQIFPEVNGGTTDVDNVDVHKSLASNGGFELGTTSWNIMPGTNFVAYSNGQPTSTDRAYSGTRFAATNTGQSNGSFYQDIPVTATAGDTYCADAEMRTQTGSPSSAADTLGVFLLGGSAIDVGSHDFSGLPNDGSTWVNEKTCVTATVTQTTLRVQVYPQVNGTTVDVDNIDLHKSLAHNGGFELTTAYWNIMPGTNFVIYSNGQPTATDKAFSGTKFAASNALQSNGSFYQDIPVAANPGDEYCVDAEMRTQTGSPAPTVDTLGAFLLGGSAVDGGTHPYTNLPNDGSTWMNEKSCVTASVAQTTLRIQVFPEVNGGTVDVDNIDVH